MGEIIAVAYCINENEHSKVVPPLSQLLIGFSLLWPEFGPSL
jgi:hypothetical protein